MPYNRVAILGTGLIGASVGLALKASRPQTQIVGYDASGDNSDAVVEGLSSTARVITAAAAIMVFVFGSFVLNGDPTIKQFGVGLAVAVILDATVVRCLLVPALMLLVGERNWYMPRWLDRFVPRISIEGAEFFEQDAEPEPVVEPDAAAPA